MRSKKAKTVFAVTYTNHAGVELTDLFRAREAAETFAAKHGSTVVDKTPVREWVDVVSVSL